MRPKPNESSTVSLGQSSASEGMKLSSIGERDEDNGGRLPCIMGTDTKNLETRDLPVGKKIPFDKRKRPELGSATTVWDQDPS